MLIRAPAKLNLCLYLGGSRPDGRHDLCSLFCPLELADLIDVGEAQRDEVVCDGIEGENLAARALAALRARGWERPPLRIEISKRIPLAAGLGGASADAAAVLGLARGEVADLQELAFELGADVPSQLPPAFALVCGAGERVERLPDPAPYSILLLPRGGLPTAAVFAEADSLGLARPAEELGALCSRLRAAAGAGGSPLEYLDLLRNDLEPAATSLRPAIADDLESLREAGAAAALLSGSGPTVFGLFGDLPEARRGAERIGAEETIVCEGGRLP